MKISNILCLLLTTIILLSSCGQDSCATKSGFLESFSAFTTEVEENKSELSDEDKQAYETRYEDIVNNCYKKFKEEMTLAERQDFWKSSITFYVKLYDGQFSSKLLAAKDDEFTQYIKDEVIGIVKDSGMTFIFSLQAIVKDELPKLMELFSAEIEKFGQELFGGPQD